MNYDDYVTKKEYPEKPVRPQFCSAGDSKATRLYADKLEEYEKEVEFYNKCLNEYKEDKALLAQQFKIDAIKAVGLEGHPKAERAYEIVWEQHHSRGMFMIFQHLKDLADLLLN